MFAARIVLGLQLRDARVSRGLTQAELSGLTGIPQGDSQLMTQAPERMGLPRICPGGMVFGA